MIKVLIMTNIGNFEALPDRTANTKELALEDIENKIIGNYPIHLADGSILKIMGGARAVIATMVIEEPEPLTTSEIVKKIVDEEHDRRGGTTPDTVKRNVVCSWVDNVERFGQLLKVKILTLRDNDDTIHAMLYLIDGKPAETQIAQDNIAGLVYAWREQRGWQHIAPLNIVVPHGTTETYEEAEAYLKDYVRETAPERKPAEKNAQAWEGFRDNKGGYR